MLVLLNGGDPSVDLTLVDQLAPRSKPSYPSDGSDDDDLNLLFTKKAVIAPPKPKRVASEPPASYKPKNTSSPLAVKKAAPPQSWKVNMNFAPRKVWLVDNSCNSQCG
jgi:hypothetical protein